MTSLPSRVLRTIRRHQLFPPDARVLVALSGGSDSVALLDLLLELERAAGIRVAGVAHVHHGLRAELADRDEQFCRELAARRSLPFRVQRVDAAGLAARERRSVEDAARVARAHALAQAAAALACDRVALGHTRDDQAETVLMKLLRGAGTRGLRGIHPRVGPFVRPLLEVGRTELRDWLAGRGLSYVEDETNADPRFRRNAVRHRVLPVLEEVFGGCVEARLARQADAAREDEAVLASLASPLAVRAVRADESNVRIDRAALSEAPAALQRRVLLDAMRQAGVREPGFDQVARLIALAAGESGRVGLPGGIRASLEGNTIVLDRPERRVSTGFKYELGVPGSVWVPEAGRTLTALPSTIGENGFRPAPTGDSAVIDAGGIVPPLWVRNWRPGDRYRPLGTGGRKKLQDVFVDRKVPRAMRARMPLVVDQSDRILWVPGHTVDEAYRVTGATRAVVVLTVSESGGRE